MDLEKLVTEGRKLLQKYKYVLLILLVGMCLMLIPDRRKEPLPQMQQDAASEDRQDLQFALEELLGHLDGAGKVKVLLTQAAGQDVIFQTNENKISDERGNTVRTESVIISDSNRTQSGLIKQIIPPKYSGAVILCQGADSAAVRLAVMEAVSNAAGLSFNNITVLKMK